jgi:hypothetical protein
MKILVRIRIRIRIRSSEVCFQGSGSVTLLHTQAYNIYRVYRFKNLKYCTSYFITGTVTNGK